MTKLKVVPEVETSPGFDESLSVIQAQLDQSEIEGIVRQITKAEDGVELDEGMMERVMTAIDDFKHRLIDSATPDGLKITGNIQALTYSLVRTAVRQEA